MTTWGSTRCRRSAPSPRLSVFISIAWLFWGMYAQPATAQVNSPASTRGVSQANLSGSTLTLHAVSTLNVASELGGAFKSGSKCDADGNLYIRKFALDRPLLGPVVKIDRDGKRVALFDPAAFAGLGLDRADGFSPAADGGIYQIAQKGVTNPRIYVLHFGSDGAASAPVMLDADLEVYTFAAFAEGNFLVSGVRREVQNRKDRGRNFTAVFSADGRELKELSFPGGADSAHAKTTADDEASPMLDLADAEVGSDGNLYVMRRSVPALIYVIAPSGKIMRMIKVAAPAAGAVPNVFHLSGNQLALSFGSEQGDAMTMVVVDAQTGRRISSYADPGGLGPSFSCFAANEGAFTFLKLGESNELEVIRAEAQ